MSNANAAKNSPPNANNSIIIADNASPIQETIFLNLRAKMAENVIPRNDSVAVAMECPCARTSITTSVINAQINRPCNTNNNNLIFLDSRIAITADAAPRRVSHNGTLGDARLAPSATPKKWTMKNGFSLS